MAETNIEQVQEALQRQIAQAQKEGAVRDVLRALDPQPTDYPLDYAALLHRLEEVVARELNTQGEQNGTVRPDAGSPGLGDASVPGP